MPAYEVANPAVIIGLGGTGKWVLTYVKKSLLDTYGGQVPRTVKLLSFDTTQEKVARDGKQQEEEARVGDVQLDRTEFIYLGGNIRQICLDIRDKGTYPYIGSWLQASTYLETVDPDAFDIGKGAGQKRPFGRMAVFYNLQSQVQSELANRIRQAITDVIAANERNTAIEIYVVSSLSGGTGAGMFIDVAHLARWFASALIRGGFAVRGFLALQNTFRSVLTVGQVEANTAAAMRELDRFMLVFDQQYPIVYNPADPNLRTIYGGQTGKLFDNCYLLDATRENLPLDGVVPKYGVYPSIADCISMLLDASTGDAYAQHYKNVNTRIAEIQSRINQPIYSSLGTYSLILPVEDIISSLTYRFALDLLGQYLLQVERRKNEHGQDQVVLTYSKDWDARKDAIAFLRTPRNGSGIDSTQFILNTPGVAERNINEVAYQREFAEMTAAELLTWILPPESDPAVAKIAKDVRDVLQTQLINQVHPSNVEGDDYVTGSDRVANGTARFKDEFLGREVAGRRVGGRYRDALEKCVDLQQTRYRMLLQEYLINALNGPDSDNKDFQQQRRGRLGYVQHLLAHLSLSFDRLNTFFDLVRTYRASTDELRSRRQEAAQLRHEMEEAKVRGSFLGTFIKGIHPAVKAQQAYLEAEQDLIDYEINELMFEHLRLAGEALRQITDEHKTAIDDWINTLLMGFSGNFADPGAYKYLTDGLARHTSNREEKKRILVHEYVTDAEYENGLYRSHTQGKFEEAFARLVWSMDQNGSVFRLRLPGLTIATSDNLQGRTATDRNAAFLLDMARDYFAPLRELTIAERLNQREGAAGLALKLSERCSPMVRFDPQRQGSQELNRFVCVNEGHERSFFNEFGRAFRTMASQARENQVLPAANPFTCTILTTADVISSYGLLPYIAAEESYNKYPGDARLLHVFPAEVHAVELEQKLPSIREPRHKFAPRLTAMLEDRKRVEEFVLCYLYRFISLEAAGGINNRYVLRHTASGRRGIGRFELSQAERAPSLFTAMETFIFRGTDINSHETRINFEQLDQDLRSYEAQAIGGQFSFDSRTRESSIEGGDDSRLINLLERSLDHDIDLLRRSSIPIERDLGCLMALIVDEIIEGLHGRLRARGQVYDARAEPLLPAPSAAPISAPQPPAASEPAPRRRDGSNESLMARRARLEAAYRDGILTHEEYEAKLREIGPDGSATSELRARLEAAYRDGILTHEEYEAKLREIGA